MTQQIAQSNSAFAQIKGGLQGALKLQHAVQHTTNENSGRKNGDGLQSFIYRMSRNIFLLLD